MVGEYEIDRCDRYNSVTGTLIPGQDAHVALQPDQVNVINIQFCISAVPPA